MIFNQTKLQFEVYALDEVNKVQALMLIQTVDQVKQQLKDMMIQTIRGLPEGSNEAETRVCYCGSLFINHNENSEHTAVEMIDPSWENEEGHCVDCNSTVMFGPSEEKDYYHFCTNKLCKNHTKIHTGDQDCPEWVDHEDPTE